jgi:hypothetical protein
MASTIAQNTSTRRAAVHLAVVEGDPQHLVFVPGLMGWPRFSAIAIPSGLWFTRFA